MCPDAGQGYVPAWQVERGSRTVVTCPVAPGREPCTGADRQVGRRVSCLAGIHDDHVAHVSDYNALMRLAGPVDLSDGTRCAHGVPAHSSNHRP
jgi:hypothetical protein